MAPTSPTRLTRRKHSGSSVPAGFRSPPKSVTPIHKLTTRELHDLHKRNTAVLSSPGASKDSYGPRLATENSRIEKELSERGVIDLNEGITQLHIVPDEPDEMDTSSNNDPISASPPKTRMIDAKRRIISRHAPATGNKASIGFEEAMAIEQRAYVADKERKERMDEKKLRQGVPVNGVIMSKEERERRIWEFMNHKPTDSDLEDDSDYDEDEDPANWFDDDQDDGRKGQDIVEPDVEDYSDIIVVDESRVDAFNTFKESRNENEEF